MTTKIDDALTVTGGIVADTPQLITGDGTIVLPASVGMPKTITLTKGSAAAITLPAPTAVTDDGKTLYIYSETAFAHVVTCPVGFKRKGSSGTATATGAADNCLVVVARNGQWDVVLSLNFIFDNTPDATLQLIPGDGTIVLPTLPGVAKTVVLTKGSAAAITLPAPVAGALPTGDDGKIVVIFSETAFAHVVTCAQGFNRKGSSGTATASAAANNQIAVIARNGQWDVWTNQNFTLA